MQRLKDAGLNCVNMNVEVWTPEIFAEVCPGKSKYRGWEGYMEAYLDARDVFGPGNAGSNFVGGVSMLAANGHKTWQESRDSLIEGMRWLLKNGLYATVHCIRLGAGSIYSEDLANETKLPPTEYFLDAGLAHHQACMEYNTFETYNKLFFCPLDCIQTLYAGEISMIELAGDVGKWAAQAVPDEANWLSRFITKHEPAAQPWERAREAQLS